jgi:aminopeptidase N
MVLSLVCALVLSPGSAQAAQAFVDDVRAAAKAGSYDRLRIFFVSPDRARALESMIGGPPLLRSIGISAMPAPPGFEQFGKYWIVFHKYQELEGDHDMVFPVNWTAEGYRMGGELPEDLATAYRITNYDFEISVDDTSEKVTIVAVMDIARTGAGPQTLIMRMNDSYSIKSAKLGGKTLDMDVERAVESTKFPAGQAKLIRCGSLICITNAGQGGKLALTYSASLNLRGLDKTTKAQLLLTSYWYPTIGRQPATSRTRITGPRGWQLLSNGNLEGEKTDGTTTTFQYKNSVPLTWLHVVGGPYQVVAETIDRGRKFRALHLTPDAARGKADVESARAAVAFFEDRFGPFPYTKYDVVDTPDFYGVECYSFTVLVPTITSWATSHEVGHTYFGGLVPNTYLKSIWNESITQYVDSILLKDNADRTLQEGYAGRRILVALSDPFTPHGPVGNMGYYRGAFVMRMLQEEIGLDKVISGLRALVESRRGKTTEWSDIEKAMSAAAGSNLSWFFDQWVRGKGFPTVIVSRGLSERIEKGRYNLNLVLAQSSRQAFRLRFDIVVETADGEKRVPIAMDANSESYDLEFNSEPRRVHFDPLGKTLATLPQPYRLTNGTNLAR